MASLVGSLQISETCSKESTPCLPDMPVETSSRLGANGPMCTAEVEWEGRSRRPVGEMLDALDESLARVENCAGTTTGAEGPALCASEDGGAGS